MIPRVMNFWKYCKVAPILTLGLLLAGASPAAGESSPAIRVLVVDGFSNHDWKKTTAAILDILGAEKDLEVKVSTVPEASAAAWAAWLPAFEKYDVVIQTCNDLGNQGSWPEPAKEALTDYVKGGGGLLVYHSANNAFADWPAYNEMIGLGWRRKDFGAAITIADNRTVRIPAGEGGNTSHGQRVNALVTRLGEHPIHRGLPERWMAADIEVYRYARGPANHLTVLSHARDEGSGLNFPIEWTVDYGKGRVYNSTYGHYWADQDNPPGIRCVAFRTLLVRATRWLAKRDVGPQPQDFPSATSPSLHSK
jgi:type 1 glutamine amidotransferase